MHNSPRWYSGWSSDDHSWSTPLPSGVTSSQAFRETRLRVMDLPKSTEQAAVQSIRDTESQSGVTI